jgi:hypothetical protein
LLSGDLITQAQCRSTGVICVICGQRIEIERKRLTASLVLSYTKQLALIEIAQHEGKNFNDDDDDIQTASDEMAAVRRHVCGRLLVRPDLVSAQYVWRQTRTRSVHR